MQTIVHDADDLPAEVIDYNYGRVAGSTGNSLPVDEGYEVFSTPIVKIRY